MRLEYYLELFEGWLPQPVTAPVVLVRATDPVPQREHADTEEPPGWSAAWDFDHTTIEARGNHQTMMNEYAATTAAAISDWLRQQ